MPLSPGERLGQYEIVATLGAGGMGVVYKARDTRLQRPAAIKVITSEHDHGERLRRLEREALSASALNHPNILTVYELGTHEGHAYIATELVEGETLRERLRTGPLALLPALDIAVQIAAALEAAHAAGIVHRDIKPENVMIRSDGYVKVLDFGIAKLIPTSPAAADSNTLTMQTMPGMLIGTVAYMAPEQVRGLAADHRADIWSFGLILHEMLTGRSPFSGPTQSDVIAAVLERALPSLASVGVAAPAELERILGKALAKDREERYQSMKELALDLRQLRETQKYDSRTQKQGTSQRAEVITKPVAAPSSRRRFSLAATGVAAVLVAWAVWINTPGVEPGSASPPGPAAVPAPPAPPDSSPRTFEYWLTVEAQGSQRQAVATSEVFTAGSGFSFNFTNPEPGYVYVLNEARGPQGVPILTVLYPTPSSRGGSAAVPAGEVVRAGRYVFRNAGVEKVWIVWSAKPHEELERAKRYVTEQHQGQIKDGPEAAIILGMLLSRRNETKATVNTDSTRTTVTGRGDLLVHLTELRVRGGT